MDGTLHQAEIALLSDMAGVMGLPAEEAAALLTQANELDFFIPEKEPERYLELRMVVLMMVSDGEIHPNEFKGCQELTRRLGLPLSVLEEVVSFYLEKQQEKQRHLGIYQNLYLVAAADGEIGEAEATVLKEIADSLGLVARDLEPIMSRAHELDFIIPEDEEERFYSLKNLIYMMVVDGEVDEREYAMCVRFAEQIGLTAGAVEEVLNEYEALRKERQAEQPEIDRYNLDVYLDVFNAFRRVPLSAREKVMALEHAVVARNFWQPIGEAPEHERAFYDLLWLACVRGMQLDRSLEERFHLLLGLAQTEGHFKALRAYLIEIEQQLGGSRIELPELSLETVQHDLAKFFAQQARF